MTCTLFYVTPTNGNQSCPSNQDCHPLSYYINNVILPSNVTFMFMNGEHTIKEHEVLKIEGLNNVSLLGQGQWVQGFHWSVMQSSVIIRCITYNGTAINVSNTTTIQVNCLTITNCSKGMIISSVFDAHCINISIQNSSHVGLMVDNVESVIIENSLFSRSRVNANMTLVKIVSISYSNFTFGYEHENFANGLLIRNDKMLSLERIIEIYGCLFYSNAGYQSGAALLSNTYANYTVVIQNTTFQSNNGDQSGGLYIHTSEKGHSEIVIRQVTFSSNTGVKNIGGANLVVNGFHSTVTIANTTFISNIGYVHGGLFLVFKGNSSLYTQIKDTTFSYNSGLTGLVGGALISMISDCFSRDVLLHIHNTVVINNRGSYGGALNIQGNVNIIMTNVNVTNNTLSKIPTYSNGNVGALWLACLTGMETVTLTNVLITDNNMTGFLIQGCVITFTDKSSVIANNKSPGNGGGIYADDNTVLSSSVIVYIINNTATNYGGAIYSTASPIMTTFLSTRNIPYYSFHYFYVIFWGDYASIAGNDIYGGYFYISIFNQEQPPDFFETVTCGSGMYYPQLLPITQSMASLSSAPFGACVCTNDTHINCTKRVYEKNVYPGQTIILSLVTVGLCESISPGLLVTKDTGISITLNKADQETDTHCKDFTYQLKAFSASAEGNFSIQTSGSLQLDGSLLTINVNVLSCPLGLELDMSLGVCACCDKINSIKGKCNVSWMPYPIKRSGNNWLSYNEKYGCIITHINCPFDYCYTSIVSLNLSNSDFQCALNRSGVLCGQCQSGLSLMLGSNKCSVCTNSYLALLAAFIFAGLCLCIFLLTLNLTVSIGAVNGLLFYANMIKLNKSVLFPNKQVPFLSQFIAWINLDLGIETCFFNGLDGYWKTWLQYAFSLSIITGLIICCRYSGRLSRLCGKNVVPVLSTLIFMAHSKLLVTIKNALMVTKIQCEHTTWNVWSVDGNIEYLHGKHIPLFVVSLVMFIIGFLYTGWIFSGQWLQRYTGKYCKSSLDPFIVWKPFLDAYNGPYKDKYQFWTGLLLMIRLFVTALFAATTGIVPQVNNYVITIIVIILLPASRGVYKNKFNTILEMFFLFNLGLVSLLNTVSNEFTFSVDAVSIGLSLIVFIGIVVGHVYMFVKRKCGTKLNIFNRRSRAERDNEVALLEVTSTDTSDDETEMYSPARTIHRRESLIFDFEITS